MLQRVLRLRPALSIQKVHANDATFIWTKQYVFISSKRGDLKYRESHGNRAGDRIRAAGAGTGRDRLGTLPAEG